MQTFCINGVNTLLRFCWSVWLLLKIVEGEVACACTAHEGNSTLLLDNDVLFMECLFFVSLLLKTRLNMLCFYCEQMLTCLLACLVAVFSSFQYQKE